MPELYTRQRFEVMAIQFVGNFEEIEAFVGGDAEFRDGELVVATPAGPLRAAPGDWIAKSRTGRFYSYKPATFASEFLPVL